MGNVCPCIDAIIIATACAEAMEHNTVVSKEARSIGINVKRLLSEDQYDKLTFDHGWLENPIIEPMAGFAFHSFVRDIFDKCGAPKERIDNLQKLFSEAREQSETKGQFEQARRKFIDIKMEIQSIAQDLCKND